MREGLDPLDIARLLALQNLSEADASINCWNDKYHWDFWRPWNAIPRSGGRQSGHGIRPHLCAAGDAAVRHFDSFSQVLDGILEAPSGLACTSAPATSRAKRAAAASQGTRPRTSS